MKFISFATFTSVIASISEWDIIEIFILNPTFLFNLIPFNFIAGENEESQEIEVFYADDQLLQLEQRTKTITFKDDSDKYSQTYAALQNSDQPELIPLWNNIDLLSAHFNQGKLTLDVHIPDEARLGAGGETLALDALRETSFQFDEVTSIELLVDGNAAESLMGHAELEHPLTRE